MRSLTLPIDYAHLQHVADSHIAVYWKRFRKVYPQLQAENPKAIICNRLKTTAGYAFMDETPQYIRLSAELFWQYQTTFVQDTIPHELAHLVAYVVYEDSGHGDGWYSILEEFDIKTSRLHTLVNHIHQNRKLERLAGV